MLVFALTWHSKYFLSFFFFFLRKCFYFLAGTSINATLIRDDAKCALNTTVSESVAITAFAFSFFTVFGNSLVVIAIVRDPYKELKTIPNYLILNLAVCDLIVGIPCEFLVGLLHFYPSQHLHFVAYTSLYFAMVASSLTILTLAFERYVMVEAPLRSKEYLIYSHPRLSIVYIWLIALCVALLSLPNYCNEKEYRLIITDAIGIPTMLFMFFIYSRIFYLVRTFIRQDLEKSTSSERQGLLGSENLTENIRKRERKIAMSVFLFVGAFFLCWAPCFVMENVFYKPNLDYPVVDYVRFLGLLSSLLNPLIYALRYDKFRKAIREIFRSCRYRSYNFSVISEDFIARP